jgi:predicted PurR-regulated permease PerM
MTFVLAALGVYAVRGVFAPLVIALIIAYILYPIARYIQHSTPIPHGPASALLFLIMLAIIIPLAIILIPFIFDQVRFLRDLTVQLLTAINTISPDTTIQILGLEVEAQSVIREVTTALGDLARSTARSALEVVFDAAEIILLTVFTFIIGFYLTKDGDRLLKSVEKGLPKAVKEDVSLLMGEVNVIWSAFLRGHLLMAIIVGVTITVISSLIGLPRPALMGILAGLLEFVPGVGPVVWLVVASIIALIEGSTVIHVSNLIFALIVVLIYIGYAQLVSNVLYPRVVSVDVQIHPMLVIIGVIVGASLAGLLGVVLAAPAIATLRVLARYLYGRLFDLEPFPKDSLQSHVEEEVVSKTNGTEDDETDPLPPDNLNQVR